MGDKKKDKKDSKDREMKKDKKESKNKDKKEDKNRDKKEMKIKDKKDKSSKSAKDHKSKGKSKKYSKDERGVAALPPQQEINIQNDPMARGRYGQQQGMPGDPRANLDPTFNPYLNKELKRNDRPLPNPLDTQNDYRQLNDMPTDGRRNQYPDLGPNRDYQQSQADDRHGNSKAASKHVDGLYYDALRKLISKWPEYEALNKLNHKHIDPVVMTTLQQVYQRLCEQHDLIGSMSKDALSHKQNIESLEEEIESYRNKLKSSELDMEDLRQEVIVLKEDLRRKGMVPRVAPKSTRPRYEQDPMDQNQMSYQQETERTIPDPSDPRYALARRLKEGMDDNNVRNRLQKIQSGYDQDDGEMNYLYTSNNYNRQNEHHSNTDSGFDRERDRGFGNDRGYGFNNDRDHRVDPGSDRGFNHDRDIRGKLDAVQSALERERKKCSKLEQELQEAKLNLKYMPPDYADLGGRKKSVQLYSGLTIKSIVDKYNELQYQADTNIIKMIDRYVQNVNDNKKFGFICATMEESFKVAASLIVRFQAAVASLLSNPLNSHDSHVSRKRQIANFASLPSLLADEIMVHLESTSEETNVIPIFKMVEESLSRIFPEIYSSGIFNQPDYHQFMTECCRLSWKMNVTSPPMYLTSLTHDNSFDSQYHQTNNDRYLRQGYNEIDYFIWPTLFRKIDGDVIVKGLVLVR